MFAAHAKGVSADVGRFHAGHRDRVFCGGSRLRVRLRAALKGVAMIIDYALAILVTVGLLVYLTYALLRPERF
jgi:K+-transporting ATPase KdpF subunit